jgi:hypothetical protein
MNVIAERAENTQDTASSGRRSLCGHSKLVIAAAAAGVSIRLQAILGKPRHFALKHETSLLNTA